MSTRGLALATGTDAATRPSRTRCSSPRRARQVDLGSSAAAAATVAAVSDELPVRRRLLADHQRQRLVDHDDERKRYTVGDSSTPPGTIANAMPFVSAKDPRVPTTPTRQPGFDSTTPFVDQRIWGRDDPIADRHGLDARLIEAEAKLQANDIARHDGDSQRAARRAADARASSSSPATLAPLATPATTDAATSLFFREKAFWRSAAASGCGDLRRLVRQYGRTQDKVFPSGTFFKNGRTARSWRSRFRIATRRIPTVLGLPGYESVSSRS